jgi:hypothetical protein
MTEALRHRWSQCSLTDILVAFGNEPRQRADGRWASGHEPVHSSFSGTCVTTDTDKGVWYCSSCESGGGALALVAGILGDDRVAARAWLSNHFTSRFRGNQIRARGFH